MKRLPDKREGRLVSGIRLTKPEHERYALLRRIPGKRKRIPHKPQH